MSNQLALQQDGADALESTVIGGDLSKLTPAQRVMYYQRVCSSLGLNPLTRPFDYITLNGKLTLYARKDCTEQLRKNHEISIDKPDIRFEDEWIIVTVAAHNADGRTDSDIGVVNRKDMQNNFGNALMKAVTKAKRRVTLSICGLGMLDETEIETIPQAEVVEVTETGEIATNGGNTKAPETADADAWEKWNALVDQANELGLTVPVPDPATPKAKLRAYYRELQDQIKAKESEG